MDIITERTMQRIRTERKAENAGEDVKLVVLRAKDAAAQRLALAKCVATGFWRGLTK